LERVFNGFHVMWWKRHSIPVSRLSADDPAFDRRELLEVHDEVQGWLVNRIDVGEAEAKHTVRVGGRDVPFGLINARWRRLVAQMRPGDELWEFRKRPPEVLAMREGVVLLRSGEVIAVVVTVMS
jgi:hypothetical protein